MTRNLGPLAARPRIAPPFAVACDALPAKALPAKARPAKARSAKARPAETRSADARSAHLVIEVTGYERTVWLLALAALVALAALSGCQRAAHEEPEHHLPAHRPADYPAAITRLENLHQQFLAVRASTGESPAGASKTGESSTAESSAAGTLVSGGEVAEPIDPFDEFHDVARWLPELAGDSDLGEAEWVRVNRQAKTLVDAFAPVRAAAAAARPNAYGGRREVFESGLRELRAVAESFPRGRVGEARE
ncbi:MAG: hypothetical protein ACKO38_10310 [Planctomycetota bacterium]